MKLFIDDIRDEPEGWTFARKVEQAIRIIAEFSPDIISIDHDIENRPDDETFLPVAYFIGEKYQNDTFWADDLEVIIHSINPVGAQRIAAVLESYGIYPTIAPYKLAEFNKKWGIES